MFKIWMRKKEEFEISSYTEERAKESSKKEEEKWENAQSVRREHTSDNIATRDKEDGPSGPHILFGGVGPKAKTYEMEF